MGKKAVKQAPKETARDLPDVLAERITSVPVAQLVQHPENPRRGNVSAIRESIRANGFFAPLVVQRSTMHVLAGNHRLQAARGEGLESLPCVVVDVDDARARKIMLADNRSNDMASYDEGLLASVLESIKDELEGSLFTSGDLAKLLASSQPPEAGPPVFLGTQIVDAALAFFRRRGFPYPSMPLHVAMQEINDLHGLADASLISTTTAYRVPDGYHPHRFHSTSEGKVDAITAFLDDKRLRKAFETELLGGRRVDEGLPPLFGLTQNVQIPSNFRPGFALWMLRRFCPKGGTWLDTSTGYGGRLVGFVASDAGAYIGIDPSTKTHAGNTRMAADLGVAKRVQLVNQPAEDVDVELVRGRADFCFTSPPYFSKEHYAEEDTQSFKRYGGSCDAWVAGFLVPMMRLQHEALRPGCLAIVNIADVLIKSVVYPLEEHCIAAGRAVGFTFDRREDFPLPPGSTHFKGDGEGAAKRAEAVLVFRKAA